MKIPIFPLNGAIMFPNTNLPLNIFEERYIDMVDYTLSKNKIIGMIQRKANNELYDIGCYGKITAFNETPDKSCTDRIYYITANKYSITNPIPRNELFCSGILRNHQWLKYSSDRKSGETKPAIISFSTLK